MTNPTPHGQVPDALIYAELPEHAATGLGQEYESFDQNGKPMGKAYENLVYYTADQMRAFADATCALRASHGQAPAQAAPAAVAGPKKWAPEEVEDGERGIRWVTNEGIHGRPTDHDVREYLKRTPTANGCLCDECKVFYAAAPTTQPAPQQEAQEPVAWYVTGCGRLLDEDEAKAEARHIGGTARAIPVYTAPQPSPAAQGDALESEYQRGYRQGYEQRDAEVRGALV